MYLEEMINAEYSRLNENDILIWQYIQLNKRECCEIAIEDLAQKCCISRTTISRFTQKLGFTGFREFKDGVGTGAGENGCAAGKCL